MPTIGSMLRKDNGTYEGQLSTLQVRAKIVMLPVQNPSDKGPHYRIFTTDRIEIGAAWIKTSKTDGSEYISLKLQDPSFGVLYANLGTYPGQDDPDLLAIIWNPR